MKKYLWLIALSLVTGLFIYIFYRSDRTVINLIVNLFGKEHMTNFRLNLRHALPLPDFMVYSLPEGLWILAATLISRQFYFSIHRIHLQFYYLPIAYAGSLEIVQKLHLWNGRFDWMDLLFSSIGWGVAMLLPIPPHQINIRQNFNRQLLPLGFIYAIVFLSHVSN